MQLPPQEGTEGHGLAKMAHLTAQQLSHMRENTEGTADRQQDHLAWDSGQLHSMSTSHTSTVHMLWDMQSKKMPLPCSVSCPALRVAARVISFNRKAAGAPQDMPRVALFLGVGNPVQVLCCCRLCSGDGSAMACEEVAATA